MDWPTVLIGCPVRNRAWVLPEYLSVLEALDYPQELLRFAFVLNDCEDASEAILAALAARRPDTRLVTMNLGSTRWRRGHYSYANLALLRNRLLEETLASGAAFLFSVDSDVMLPADALRRLLSAGKAVVGARVPNDLHLGPARGRCNFLRYDPVRRRMAHVIEFPPDALMEVDVTGAAVLIRRDVIEAGCRYGPAFTGEDEGFCTSARSRGYSVWVDTGTVCQHRMTERGG